MPTIHESTHKVCLKCHNVVRTINTSGNLCPRCGFRLVPPPEYSGWEPLDVTLFQFGRKVTCECGHRVGLDNGLPWEGINRILEGEEEERIRLLQRLVDRISRMIVSSDYPDVDIDLEIERVRDKCRELFPGKDELFRLIYDSRFKRLRDQFREKPEN